MKGRAYTLAAMLMFSAECLNAQVIYSDRSSFMIATGGGVTETFESAILTGNLDSGAVASMAFSGFTVSSTPAAIKIVNSPLTGAHNTTPGGTKYLYLDTDSGNTGSSSTFMAFGSPVTAFGLSLTDLDVGGITITIPGQGSYSLPRGADGDERFWGFTSSVPFSSVSLDSGHDSAFGVDDVVLAPEPAAPKLLLLGLCWLAVFRLRPCVVSYGRNK